MEGWAHHRSGLTCLQGSRRPLEPLPLSPTMGKPPAACILSRHLSVQACPVGGSTMTITLMVLLCLGLCLSQMTHVQAETLPIPIIWAEPDPVVAQGKPVSIWCQGSQNADQYCLYREGVPEPLRREFPLEPSNKAKFPFPHMTYHLAGRYSCLYHRQTSWSVPSKPLDLVVTGMFNKPSFSALPSPIVTSGGSVTLQCGSWQEFDWFVLCSEEGEGHPRHLDSQHQADGWFQALFTVDHVSPSHRQAYRCYGYFSSSPYVWSTSSHVLELLISGVSRKPSLSVLPGPVVAPGQSLTLQCHSDVGYNRFALSKEGAGDPPQRLAWQPQAELSGADFPLGPVRPSHGGRYTCYGGHTLSSEWSVPSDPLDILVAGQLPYTPSLSVQLGPTVAPGENVTLLCQSRSPVDTFLLSKEGAADPPLRLRSQYRAGQHQAEFPMSPVTSAHGGTYRCYGSASTSPYLLSQPSDPLELLVSGPSMDPSPPTTGPGSADGPHWYLYVLITASVAFVLLLSLLVLLLIHHQRRVKGRKPGAADLEPKDRGLHNSSSPVPAAQEESLYAAIQDIQPEEGVELDHRNTQDEDPQGPTYAQVTASDTLQDVTYAQLNCLTLRQETRASPHSQSGDPPAKPSVYAALAFQ
ncbi:leukocyte immunoglobulin-like receptor subfamily A member 6 isoform X2 [Lutra lutra]|uniref:leukocyte immunoglobulin-like receptor subfamily A member 6 isoform X2 n=1 Tax=Lutra lutra TaxID=9657 RepID=UPI001FD490B9|nr:leukocyte immunoglobulin-like receptor subfamily A member 6 isoform X2 [Lutra lutra]